MYLFENIVGTTKLNSTHRANLNTLLKVSCLKRYPVPDDINRVKLHTLFKTQTLKNDTLFSGSYPFLSISFLYFNTHPTPSTTHQHVTWSLNMNECHRGRGWIQDYLVFTCIMQVCRLNLLNLQVGNYWCECSQCRVRVRVTHRSWFTWSSSWRNVAESSRRMIRENTEFPLDAIWNEKATFPQSYADLADFRCLYVYTKRQTWICTTWPSFPFILYIASTQK